MALAGNAILIFWQDVTPEGEADYKHWHVFEHMPERVGVPGFRRGRRYGAIQGSPKFCMFYELDTMATAASKPYVDRLNDPTPWTTRQAKHFTHADRTICDVVASLGKGEGGVLLTVRFSTADGAGETVERTMADDVMPPAAARPGVVGVHLLRGDQAASYSDTKEKRDRPQIAVDRVLLVDAVDVQAIERLRADLLSDAALAAHGLQSVAAGIYQLEYSLREEDL